MDNSTRLRMRRAHANHARYCSCGKVVYGNGGRWSHHDMHERRADGHRYISYSAWQERFGDRPTPPVA